MRANRVFLGVSGASLVLVIVAWFVAARVRRATEADFATLKARRQALIAGSQHEEQRAVAAERRYAELEEALAGVRTGESGANASAVPQSPSGQPRTMYDLISGDPMLEVLELRRQRAGVHQDYGEFFLASGLAPAQVEKFLEIRVRWAERGMDLDAAARIQDEAGKQTVASLKQKAEEDYYAAQAALLGPELYRSLLDYERTIPLRNILVRGLAGAAAVEGMPLTDRQGDQLLQAAMSTAQTEVNTKSYELIGTIDWDAFDAQARQILTPEQFTLFTTLAPPSGFSSRWKYKLETAVRRAQERDAALAPTGQSKPGG